MKKWHKAVLLVIIIFAGCKVYNYSFHRLQSNECGLVVQGQNVLSGPYSEGTLMVGWPWNGFVKFNMTEQKKDSRITVVTADSQELSFTATLTYKPKSRYIDQLYMKYGSGDSYQTELIEPLVQEASENVLSLVNKDVVGEVSGLVEKTIVYALKDLEKSKVIEICQLKIKRADIVPLLKADKTAYEELTMKNTEIREQMRYVPLRAEDPSNQVLTRYLLANYN